MNQFMLSLLLGVPDGGAGGAGGNPIMQFLPFIAIIGIFYFLIIRPQNKKQKETRRMLESLKKGDRVVTIGGMHGVIQSVRESSVIVKVDENTKVEFSRSAVASVESRDRVEEKKAGKAEIEDKAGEAPEESK
jgi:preprotein translocase subunit YajC